MLDALISSLLSQTDSVSSLPVATHILAVLGLGCGLVLWLVGQRVLKPAFGVLGAVLGGLIGFMTMPSIAPETIAGIPSPYAGLALGAAFGLGAGLMLFRFALAISTALALGLAGILIGAAAIHFAPMQDATRNLGTLKSEASRAAVAPIDPTITRKSDIAIARARPVAQVVREFVQKRSEEVEGAWNQLLPHDKVVLALSGAGGLAAGFFIGLFFPRKSAALATALFGSAVWIPSLIWIVNALEVPGRQHLDRSTVFWLITWCVVAAVGVIVQVSSERRKAPKAEN
jgi:hypothetical protein